jgi:hemolysin activation/secretion protein
MRHTPPSLFAILLRSVLAALVVTLLSGVSAHETYAQSASQITPHTFEPTPQPQGGEIVIPEASGPKAPEGAGQLFVQITGVEVESGLPALRAQEQAITAELVGKRISVAELFAVARKLEQAYIAAGYALVRVVLPAQRLRDGATVHFIIINGYVERIDTSALPDAIRGRVVKLLSPLVGRRGLTLPEIERALLLAGDLPGTALRSTLAPGSEPGAGVLVLEARHQPVTGFVSFDNTLSKELGSWTTGLGLDANSVSGLGELVYVRASGRPGGNENLFTEEPRNRTLAAGVTIPIGANGLSFNLEVTDARTTPLVDDTGLGTTSLFTRYSARLNYPLVRRRDVTVNLQTALDFQQERVRAITPMTEDLSLDRLRILRGGGGVTWFAPGEGVVTGRLTGSYGIGGRKAPADNSDDTPLSRQGEDPIFQKLEMSFDYAQPLAAHLAFDFAARAQTSFNRVMASAEQISLSGATGLSPVASGQVQGDSGYVLRAEAQFPFMAAFNLPSFSSSAGAASKAPAYSPGDSPGDSSVAKSGESEQSSVADAGAMLTPYLFGACGTVTFARPTTVESAVTHGAAYGLGLRLGAAPRASFSAAMFRLEYGHYTLGDKLGDGNRLTLTVSFQF